MAEVKKRKPYNKALLDECIQRDGATLIGDYDKITCNIRFKYNCRCGAEYDKTFKDMYLYGTLCKSCTTINKLKKMKKVFIELYGVENPQQNKEIKVKTNATNLERYGFENPTQNSVVRAKTTATNLERYGFENPNQNSVVRAKTTATNLERYGVENPTQNKEIFEKAQKNNFSRKEVTMPSGIVRKVQGYEHFALKELIQIYTEDQIKTGCTNVPRIQYDIDGKKHYYFPDIFIPHENKLIEVKSKWTYLLNSGNVQAKKNACVDQGFIYEVWCYDKKGNRIEI